MRTWCSRFLTAPLALSVIVAACNDGPSGPEQQPPPGARAPAALVLTTSPAATQRAGVAFAQQPVVSIRDSSGNVTKSTVGVAVEIASGGGSLSGTLVVAAVDGIATFTNLAITGATGDRTLRFSVSQSSVIAPAVTGPITVTAGAAASLELTTPPDTAPQTHVALARKPVVRVLDAFGNVTNDQVTVTATTSGGVARVVAGAAEGTASGTATFNTLTLASATGRAGIDTIRFAVAGLPAVLAQIRLVCQGYELAEAASVTRTLRAGDCKDSRGIEHHVVSVKSSGTFARRYTMTGDFRTALYLRPAAGWDRYWGYHAPAGSGTTTFRYIGGAGETTGLAGGAEAAFGTYTLQSEVVPEDVAGCARVIVGPAVTTNQSLASGDCEASGHYRDFFDIPVGVGLIVTVTMTGSGFVPQLALYRYGEGVDERVVVGTGAGNTRSFTYTNATGAPQLYYVYASSDSAGATGRYTLSVTYPPVSGSSEPPGAADRPPVNAGPDRAPAPEPGR